MTLRDACFADFAKMRAPLTRLNSRRILKWLTTAAKARFGTATGWRKGLLPRATRARKLHGNSQRSCYTELGCIRAARTPGRGRRRMSVRSSGHRQREGHHVLAIGRAVADPRS